MLGRVDRVDEDLVQGEEDHGERADIGVECKASSNCLCHLLFPQVQFLSLIKSESIFRGLINSILVSVVSTNCFDFQIVVWLHSARFILMDVGKSSSGCCSVVLEVGIEGNLAQFNFDQNGPW